MEYNTMKDTLVSATILNTSPKLYVHAGHPRTIHRLRVALHTDRVYRVWLDVVSRDESIGDPAHVLIGSALTLDAALDNASRWIADMIRLLSIIGTDV